MNEEYPTEKAEAPDTRPLPERLVDKNWKKRLNAYEDLHRLISSGDASVFETYVEFFPKMLGDMNAACGELAVDTLIVFTELAPPGFIGRHVESFLPNIVDKTFGPKPTLMVKGQTLALKLMEVDDPTVTTQYLLSRLGDKKPKVVIGALEVIREGIISYGVKSFPVKDIINALGPVFNGINGDARDQAMSLLVELHKWVGKATLKVMEMLRTAQKESFETLIAEHAGKAPPTPTIYLRKERPAPGSIPTATADTASGPATASAATASGGLDEREYVDEIDLMKKLKSTQYPTLVVEEKWDDQQSALQIVMDTIGPTPKIKKSSDIGDLVAVCKNFLRAGHVNVQVSSLKVLSLLADGLRKEFSTTASKAFMEMIILKYKEKKLVPECHNFLIAALRYSVELNVMIDCLAENVKNKKNPPHARIGLLEFLSVVLLEFASRVTTEQMRILADLLVDSADDPDPKIREVCASCLISLALLVKTKGKSAGEALSLLNGLESSSPRVFAKIKPALVGEITAPTASEGADEAPRAAPKVVSSKKSIFKKKDPAEEPIKPAPLEKAPSVKTGNTSSAPKKAGASAKAEDDIVEDLTMSGSDAQDVLAALDVPGWADVIQEKMDNAAWQGKVEAMEAISKALESSNAGGKYSGPLLKYLESKTSGFKLINVNILKAVITLITTCAKHSGDVAFSKAAAALAIKNLVEKFSEKKVAEALIDMMMALSEAAGPGFVFKQAKAAIDDAKSPVAHENFLVWLKAAITEFGASKYPLPTIGTLCHTELENKVASVRSAAIEVFGALYHQLGPKMQSIALTDSIKPAVKTAIEEEFAKVGYDAKAAVSSVRQVKGEDAEAEASGGGLSRVDLSKELGGNAFLSELSNNDGKTSWQNRKNAMESLIGTCERSGYFVENTKFVGDILRNLKDRMEDSQANNKPIAANAIARLLISIEPEPVAKFCKTTVGAALIGGFGDIKKGMRDSVVAALDLIVTMNKGPGNADSAILATLVSPIAEMLKNPVGRLELLTWISSHSYAIKTEAVAEWTVPLVVCLQDKVASVRTLAETILGEISGRALISKAAIEKGFRDLPASTMRGLQPSYNKILGAYGTNKGGSSSETPAAAPLVAASPKLPSAELASTDAAEDVEPETVFKLPAKDSSAASSVSRLPQRKVDSESRKLSEKQSTDEALAVPSADKLFLKRIMKSVQLKRMEDFAKGSWPEEPGENEFNALHAVWDPFLSYDLAAVLFPILSKKTAPNQDVLVGGIIGLLAQIESPLFMQHTDLVFRWCSYGLALKETPVTLLKLLQLLITVFDKMRSEGTQMHDAEIASIMPQLIAHSGHSSERHKAAFKQAISTAAEVIAPNKLCQQLLLGLASKNNKSRVVSLEEIQRVIENVGAGALGRTGVKDIGALLEDKEADASIRNASLDLLYTVYVSLGQDMSKVTKLLGPSFSAKSLAALEERVKHKEKSGVKPSFGTPPADRYDNTEGFRLNLSGNSGRKSRSAQDDDDNDSVETLDLVSPNVNAYAEVVSAMDDGAIDGIFLDIVLKIDALVDYNAADHKDDPAAAYVKRHEGAKDYIKMLMSNVKGTWHTNEESRREDAEIIAKQANPLVRRVCLVTLHAFSPPVYYDKAGEDYEIDCTLASASLAALYAFVEKPIYMQRFTVHTMTEVIAVCARCLVDDRLYKSNARADVNDAHKLIVRAINLILLKFTETANPGLLFCALLRTFALCIPEMDRSNDTIDAGLLLSLSHESTKVVVRLFVRLMNMELKSPSPFSLPNVSVPRLMHALNDFFSCHPSKFDDDTPFCAAKTLVAQAVSSIGAESLLKVMKTHNISADNFLTKMVARLGGVEFMPQPRVNLVDLVAPTAVSEALNTELGLIIDEITGAKDKDPPIKKLYLFLRAHPEVDVQVYFQRVSLTFRRFVLDNLARIEANSIADEMVAARDKKPLIQRFYNLIQNNPHLDGNQILQSVPTELRRFILDQLADIEAAALQAGPSQSSKGQYESTEKPAESTDSVALRLLEGLKKRENLVPKVSDITKRRSSLTPRLDAVKGSLDDLSSTLQLSPSSAAKKKIPDEDSDLAARLSKLKTLGK